MREVWLKVWLRDVESVETREGGGVGRLKVERRTLVE